MVYPNICIEMKRNGFTVCQLAARLELSLDAFIFKLYGTHEFTLDEIECLADMFDCSLDYLVGRQGKRNWRTAHGDGRGEQKARPGSFMRFYSVTQLLI